MKILSRILTFVLLFVLVPHAFGNKKHKGKVIAFKELEISRVWLRQVPSGHPSTAGYLRITNTGQADERLIGVSAAFSSTAEIHQVIYKDDVMIMQPIESIAIPAGQSVGLKPGGRHLMFMGLQTDLVRKQTYPVQLQFENSGTLTLDMPAKRNYKKKKYKKGGKKGKSKGGDYEQQSTEKQE